MKLDFDTNIIRKNTIELLDCQVDLILRSLEMYNYIYQFIYPRRSKAETKEESLRVALVSDTYEQILNQFTSSQIQNPVLPMEIEFNKNLFKKIS